MAPTLISGGRIKSMHARMCRRQHSPTSQASGTLDSSEPFAGSPFAGTPFAANPSALRSGYSEMSEMLHEPEMDRMSEIGSSIDEEGLSRIRCSC